MWNLCHCHFIFKMTWFLIVIVINPLKVVILKSDDAKLSCHSDTLGCHQIVIFIQVITDTYPWCRALILRLNKLGWFSLSSTVLGLIECRMAWVEAVAWLLWDLIEISWFHTAEFICFLSVVLRFTNLAHMPKGKRKTPVWRCTALSVFCKFGSLFWGDIFSDHLLWFIFHHLHTYYPLGAIH